MSEYQYYKFVAIDKPLTQQQMGALRKLSTRAEITSTSFTNEYHWGDFRGNPGQMMEKYFDAFLYYANWGTHWFMLRLPRKLVEIKAIKPYCTSDALSLRTKGEYVVLDFQSEDESGDWEEEGGADWLATMVPLRADLLGGDLRSLYLGWLASVQAGDLDMEDVEPPVPAGMKHLSASLKCLADFLRIDPKLLKAAAASDVGKMPAAPSKADISSWIAAMPLAKKDKLLLKLLEGNASHVREQLLQDCRTSCAKKNRPKAAKTDIVTRRTVGDLLAAAGLQ